MNIYTKNIIHIGTLFLLLLLLISCGTIETVPDNSVTLVATPPPRQSTTTQAEVSSQHTNTPKPSTTSNTQPSQPSQPSPTPIPSPRTQDQPIEPPAIALEPIGGDFDQPLYVTHAGDGSGRVFVVEKAGRVIILEQGEQRSTPFLDIRHKVGSSASEQGLLSIAFHPSYSDNSLFFVNYTNLDGHTIIARYQVSEDANIADATSEKILLTIEQPAANHNGGHVLFGPDGYLYIGMGDGGRANDPWGNAQNRSVLLGKLLRIDVDSGSGDPYAIPPDNPFVNEPDMRDEIWAWGLRNPWRVTFDRRTNDMYIGDVGQNKYEEIHVQPHGEGRGWNYGWNIMEGASCFLEESCQQEGLHMPVLVYPHANGDCSVTGGYVYRGSDYPNFNGIYFFSDFCTGKIWGLYQQDGEWISHLLQQTGMNISSFGEDEAGELYVTDLYDGAVYRVVESE